MNELLDLFNVTMSLGDKVSNSWQIFVAVNTAIFGWLVTKNVKHKLFSRIAATAAYLIFSFATYKSLEISSSLYHAAIADVAIAAKSGTFVMNSYLKIQILNMSNMNFWTTYWKLIYWVSAIGVSIFIYWDILSRDHHK